MAIKSGQSSQPANQQADLRQQKKPEERGFFGKLGRTLNFGLNIAAGAAKGTIESIKGEEDAAGFIGGIREGIAENQDWADVFEEVTGNRPEGKVQRGLVFGANLVFDPINLVPVVKPLKVGGKFIAATPVGQVLTKGLAGMMTYSGFGKTFIPGFGLPKEFHKLMQGTRNDIRVGTQKIIEDAQQFWKGVPKESMDDVVGILNTGKQSLNNQANTLSTQLKQGLDNIYDELIERGIAKEEFRKEFYFPHQFEKYLKSDPAKWGSFGQFRPTKPGFLKRRKEIGIFANKNVNIIKSEFPPFSERFNIEPGRTTLTSKQAGDISKTSLFHGTEANIALKILGSKNILPNVTQLDRAGEKAISLSANKNVSAGFGDIVFEIDKSKINFSKAPKGVVKGDVFKGFEFRSFGKLSLDKIKKVHVIADDKSFLKEPIQEVVRVGRETEIKKIGELEDLVNKFADEGIEVVVHTKDEFIDSKGLITNIEGWIKNAPEVLTRYQLQANRVLAVDDLFKNVIDKFGKSINDLVETGTDDLGRIIYRDNKTDEIYKSVAKSISKDKWALRDDVADSFNNFVQGQKSGRFWTAYDNVQNTWKATAATGLLIPNAGFHVRNTMGNLWNNFLGGVWNPVRYGQAAKEQILKGANYRKMEELGMLGKGRSYADIDRIMKKVPVTSARRFWDGVFQIPRKTGNVIENNARLANYIDQIDKGKSIDEAIENTNKFLFDYTDLTDWERKWGRRIIPFYTWSRKNIPLQIEQLIKQPGKFAVPFKTKAAIEGEEPIDFDNLPPWMQDDFGIKVPEFISNRLGDQGTPHIWNPYMPFQDMSILSSPFRKGVEKFGEGIERLSPVVKMPIEIAFNESFFNGKPITEDEGLTSLQTAEDYFKYFTGQIRIKRDFDKLTDEETKGFKRFLDFFGFKTYEVNIPLSKRFRKQEAAREKSVQKKRRGQVKRGERRF